MMRSGMCRKGDRELGGGCEGIGGGGWGGERDEGAAVTGGPLLSLGRASGAWRRSSG